MFSSGLHSHKRIYFYKVFFMHYRTERVLFSYCLYSIAICLFKVECPDGCENKPVIIGKSANRPVPKKMNLNSCNVIGWSCKEL